MNGWRKVRHAYLFTSAGYQPKPIQLSPILPYPPKNKMGITAITGRGQWWLLAQLETQNPSLKAAFHSAEFCYLVSHH